MRENVGYVTVCATVDNELDKSVVINVSSTSMMGEDSTSQGTFTNDSPQLCFNFTIPDDAIFEDNSTLTVMVTSDQPRVTIVDGSIEIHIQDDDGIHVIKNLLTAYDIPVFVKGNSLSEHWSYVL